jgi:hypothetical protein
MPDEPQPAAATDELKTHVPVETPAGRLLAWVDRRRHWIFAAIAVLYLAGFTGRCRAAPDSGLYMSLGRSLAEGQGFVYNGQTHTRYEPGLPLVIAASYRIFGPDRYAPVHVFILLCSFASFVLTYRLMLRHAGRPTAVLVTGLFAACETCLRYGFQVVTDTPFLVALLIYLLGYERLVGHALRGPDDTPRREWHRWLGWLMLPAATLLMVTFRPATMTFVGAVGLATAWHVLRGPTWPIRVRHALVGLLTLACFLGFRAVDPRRQSAGEAVAREQRLKTLLTTDRAYAIDRVLTVTAPDFIEEILPEAVFGMELGTGVDTVASLVVMGAGVMLFRQHPLWATWTLATFAQCMLWLPRERYILPVLPLLLYGLWRGAVWVTSRPRLSRKAAQVTLAVLGLIYLGPNLVRDVVFLIEQRYVGVSSPADTRDPQLAPIVQMAHAIREHVGEAGVVFASDHFELSYFSERRVEGGPWSFRWPPTPAQQREFFSSIADAPAMYAVLPDTTREPVIAELVERLGMRPGEALATVERHPERKGKPAPPPLTLYRLAPARGAATPPTTAPGERPM